jgi:hypothetical protein
LNGVGKMVLGTVWISPLKTFEAEKEDEAS